MNLKKIFIISIFLFIAQKIEARPNHFKKIIIWGHKLHTHTHSYVHYGFFKAFKYLGYDTYWFDNSDNVQNFDFSESLFITEGQVDENMPLRDDCRYILHYCYQRKERYKELIKNGNAILLYPHLTNVERDNIYWPHYEVHENAIQMEPYVYYDINARFIMMPWATDLLPYEIDHIKLQVPNIKKERTIYWVGSDIDELKPFAAVCRKNHISFKQIDPWVKPASPEENIQLIQRSYFAPAIQRQWQLDHGYIPCRIFKNISYGQMGITNSKMVYELFNKKIVYSSDMKELFNKATNRVANGSKEELYELMDFVRDHHTYLNRIECLLKFMDMVSEAK